MTLTIAEESRLLNLVKDGCPNCGSAEELTLQGIEEFGQDVDYNKELGIVIYGKLYNRCITKAVCVCSNCEIEFPLEASDVDLVREGGG